MRETYWKAFKDGFVGSFVIAAVIIMAIPRVVTEFVNHRTQTISRDNGSALH